VENSEVGKRRAALEKRLANVQRWAEGARKRCSNASKLYTKRCKLTKERATELYRVLNNHQIELEQQEEAPWRLRKTIKEEKAVADAEIEEYRQRQWKAYDISNQEHRKCEICKNAEWPKTLRITHQAPSKNIRKHLPIFSSGMNRKSECRSAFRILPRLPSLGIAMHYNMTNRNPSVPLMCASAHYVLGVLG
jgi:hypothetical protein